MHAKRAVTDGQGGAGSPGGPGRLCSVLAVCCLLGLGAGLGAPALAQPYPTKPIRFIAPFPPGGATEILCRIIGQKLTEAWGQQVVVDLRPGASGSIGTELAARATPDGYTMLLGNLTPVAINPHTYRKLGYDTLRDFSAVSQVAAAPQIVVVNPSVAAKSVKELIALAKAKPGSLNYGSGGLGTLAHLGAEMFKLMAGVDMVHVPYKGTVLAVADSIAGQVQVVFSDMPPALPHVKSGKLRGLAVTGARQTPLAPGLPTVAEAGLPGFLLENWWGVLVPKGTPAPIVAKMNAEIRRALEQPDVKERYSSVGIEPVSSTPQQLAALIASESAKYAKLIKEAGIKAE
jgi:tripartite-type tricarboxylate transporter receptor subunit TctC